MYQIFLSDHFIREIKKLTKKHTDLPTEIVKVLKKFNKTSAISLGANTYKMRIGSKSAGWGKSKAFRMIVLLVEGDSIISPLTLYPKSERATISRQEIMYHIAMVQRELLHS